MGTYNLIGTTWATETITWSFATSNFAEGTVIDPFSGFVTDPIYQATIRLAFEAWAQASGYSFIESPDSRSVDIRVGWGTFPSLPNNPGDSAQYGVTTDPAGAERFAPDVLVQLEDPRFQPISGTAATNLTYGGLGSTLYQTALQAIGSAIGIDFNGDPGSVMFASTAAGGTVLGTANQMLNGTDVQAAQAVHATAQITPTTLGFPVFRFFDTHDGGHFFTTSAAERDQVLATRRDMSFEGVGYNAVDPARGDPNAAPVYRFFDTHDGGHFFTISQAERDQVLSTRPDLKFEGTGYSEHTTQQAGDTAVYRFFETTSGGHFFTASAAERDTVMATRSDMRFEGIAFYAPT